MIEISDFKKIDMRVGTIIDASINKNARKSAYKLKIDFGSDIGIKNSSAQITDKYKPEDLIGMQIIAVINFEPIRISEVKSEVLILGSLSKDGVILLTTERTAQNGDKIG